MQSSKSKKPPKIYPQPVVKMLQEGSRFYFDAVNTKLEIWVLTDQIIRFRYSYDAVGWPDGSHDTADYSYAFNSSFKEQHERLALIEKEDYFEIHTVDIVCTVNKQTLRVNIEDTHRRIIVEDESGYHWEPNYKGGGNYVFCSKLIQPGETFYGLGDKPTGFDLHNKRFQNWNTDTYGFGKDQDPLYRSIPFYYGLVPEESGYSRSEARSHTSSRAANHTIAYGIFFDNSFRSFFDFGAENPDVTSFWAEGGEMRYYFIYGPELLTVAENYAQLTGTPSLPPLWSLGYHQSKWSYFPESKVKQIATEFRRRHIPCDVIHLDIDYMDGFRCFTWNKERFPDPAKMIKDLMENGFKVVLIVDPGIKIDATYKIFKEAIENNYFCKRQDGDLMHGEVWPGDCNFPDFTNPVVRKWWSSLFKEFVGQGVRGFWNDMNEPAVFEMTTFPDDVRHNYEGLNVSHRKAHNVYGMQMARATRLGAEEYMYPHRSFVLTRAGYSGIQRYAAVWTGDNISTWEHLMLANHQCQRLSISGVSFCGSDIGGFIPQGERDGELYLRFMQMAIFHPFFRGHYSSVEQTDREPWTFGKKYELLIRKAIQFRYQLLPYIYTTFWQYVTDGTPMIRPLIFVAQHDSQAIGREDEFMLGDHLLACPIQEARANGRMMYLPKGKWYNYWTDKAENGGTELWVDATLYQIPLFVKAGAVIPQYPVMNYVGEKKIEELDLHVYYDDHRTVSTIYEDAGDGYDYTTGNFSIRRITVFGNPKELRFIQRSEGHFQPEYNSYKIHIHGLPFKVKQYIVDGFSHKLPIHNREKVFTLSVPHNFKKLRLV